MTLLEYFQQLPDIQSEIRSYAKETILNLVNKCIINIPIDCAHHKDYDTLLSHIVRFSSYSVDIIPSLEDTYSKFFVCGPSRLRPTILLSGVASDNFLKNYISDFMNTNDYPPYEHPLYVLNRVITNLSADDSEESLTQIAIHNHTLERITCIANDFVDTYEYGHN